MNANDLAIFGGPRAVNTEYKEGWRQVWPSDLEAILAAGSNDINTEAKGQGPIADFERQFAQLTGSRHALAMNSGTAALHSAYFALGVKPGAEVIVPGYTFFATAAPILQCGGRPVFCDVDPETLLADPDDVERRITSRTRAICVVHLWGNPAPMDRFVDIARRHNLGLIEDCSHAHGALYRNRAVGSWGHIGCFSLQGPKAVSAGEGGIAVTDDPVLFDRMLALGHYGRLKGGQANNTFDTDFLSLGVKYRPHLYGILLATGSLARLPELNRRRQRNYDILCEELAGCEAVQPIKTTPEAVRGGFLEFILRYTPEKAGNWKSTEFIKAAQAEGVPISKERYAQLGKSKRMLSETPIFTTLDSSELGGYLEASRAPQDAHVSPELPVVKSLAGRLLTLPPLTKVPEQFVRECAVALRKVAEYAATRGENPAPRGQAA
jgi:dTDP-4-amino-4,6-dideoxygalactose transaminase